MTVRFKHNLFVRFPELISEIICEFNMHINQLNIVPNGDIIGDYVSLMENEINRVKSEYTLKEQKYLERLRNEEEKKVLLEKKRAKE